MWEKGTCKVFAILGWKVMSQLLRVPAGRTCRGVSLQIGGSPRLCMEGDWPVFLAGPVLFQVQGDH